MSQIKLGIIGTAGRKDDAAKLQGGYYRSMYTVAQVVCELLKPDVLVSGDIKQKMWGCIIGYYAAPPYYKNMYSL